MPDTYFWLMGQILYIYCLTAFVICYFFRKFCQDPALKKLEEEEEAAEAAERAKNDNVLPNDKAMGAEENDAAPSDDEEEDLENKTTSKGKK